MQVFSLHQGRRDIDAVYSMGLFEDVAMRPQPAEGSSLEQPKVRATAALCAVRCAHARPATRLVCVACNAPAWVLRPPPRSCRRCASHPTLNAPPHTHPHAPRTPLQVDLTLEIKERKTGGLSAGGGISATGATEGALPGVVGEVSYSQRNLFGLGQRLVASAKLGQVGDGWCARWRLAGLALLPAQCVTCKRGLQEAGAGRVWCTPAAALPQVHPPTCLPCPLPLPHADGRNVQGAAHRPVGPRRRPPHLPHYHCPGGRRRGWGWQAGQVVMGGAPYLCGAPAPASTHAPRAALPCRTTSSLWLPSTGGR